MKKIIAFILALTMIFALCACCDNTDAKSPDEQSAEFTEKQGESNIPVDENDGQGQSGEEMLTGLWLCMDDIDCDYVDCVFFSSDGYTYWEDYDLASEDGFFCLNNIVECIRSDCTSNAIEDYCAYKYEENCGAEEIYQAALLAVGKYNIRNGKVTISYSDGTEDTGFIEDNSSILELVDRYGYNYTFKKYNFDLDDSYRYFVGNWNYKQEEWYTYCYDNIIETAGERNDSGSLFFGENFRANASTGAILGWGYNNGELQINDTNYNVIKISPNKFVIYHERDGKVDTYYEFAVFDRA